MRIKECKDLHSCIENLLPVEENENTIRQLYMLSKRSLVGLIAVTIVTDLLLRGCVGKVLDRWSFSLIFVASLRLTAAFAYDRYATKANLRRWELAFKIMTAVTALHFPVFFMIVVPKADNFETLMMITLALGVSSGAMSSLYPHPRLMTAYISLIIFSLIATLVFVKHDDFAWIFGGLLLFYFLMKMSVLSYIYRQNSKLVDTQKALQRQRQTLQYFYKEAPIGIFSFDKSLVVTECNRRFLEIFRLTCDEILGRSLYDFPDPTAAENCKKALEEGLQHYEGPYHSSKGYDLWVEVKIIPIQNDNGEITGGTAVIEDKTKEHDALERLNYLAMHDPLTGLSNRRGFEAYMEALVNDTRHHSSYSLLFYLDLNHFKSINDTLGHAFGDTLLQEVSQLLQRMLSDDDNLTRLGGDEFVVVLPRVSEDRETAQRLAETTAEKIQKRFEKPFTIEGIDLYISTSIGVVLIEPGFDNVDEILRYADVTMYQAKHEDRSHISYYSLRYDAVLKKSFLMQQQLMEALRNEHFTLYLQPIVSLDLQRIKGAEALIRWRHPTEGLLLPERFLPEAFEIGIISEIGWWVIETVCRTIRRWKENDMWHISYISINIDAKQLLEKGFVETLLSILKRYEIAHYEIKLEITETTLVKHFALTGEVIRTLIDHGIECFVDDFGTGYASLSSLQSLEFDTIKIDRAFTKELQNEKNAHLLRSVVSLAKEMGYRIIVEGIETQEQRRLLLQMETKMEIQGYLYAEPMEIDRFEKRYLVKR